MKDLRLSLDDIDFAKLVEFGRSIIPTYAPDWTDHNYHDPGIMLIELLAFVADAQIYALSRTRRDERAAYARLMGVEARGPLPASGLVWPSDAVAAAPIWPAGTSVPTDAPIVPDYPDAPNFFVAQPVQLGLARLMELSTRFADGKIVDWTRVNTQDGASFRPFGSAPAAGDRLVLRLAGALAAATGSGAAPISIGVEIADPRGGGGPASNDNDARAAPAIALTVAIEDAIDVRPVELAADTTNGFSRSGVLLLRIDAGSTPASDPFSITIGSVTGGFLRPPHLQRVGMNVLPVQQWETVRDPPVDFGQGLPDQSYQLANPGLIFPAAPSPVSVRLSELGTWQTWAEVADLGQCGPAERRFRFDPVARTITFGNGINGAVPPAGATLQVEYRASRGAAGNLPKGVSWRVTGIAGTFGSNSEPTSAGANARGLADLQSLARQRAREDRPLVTVDDLTEAARGFADLEVTRAMELAPGALPARSVRGSRILVAVGTHDPDVVETEPAPWLREIRRRLVPRLPVGQSLRVVAPHYVEVGLSAQLVAAPNSDPTTVREAAEARLRAALAIVPAEPGDPVWPFGRDITVLTVKGWLRNVDGVARVGGIALRQGGVDTAGAPIRLGATGLPQLTLASGDIRVDRWTAGTRR
jgi:hypothetical protein